MAAFCAAPLVPLAEARITAGQWESEWVDLKNEFKRETQRAKSHIEISGIVQEENAYLEQSSRCKRRLLENMEGKPEDPEAGRQV